MSTPRGRQDMPTPPTDTRVRPSSRNSETTAPRRGRRPAINLALQGGGAHGAFTWGVLDALLEADRFDIATVTGTSAGAVNAVALGHGWLGMPATPPGAVPSQTGAMHEGPAGARESLRAVWQAIADKRTLGRSRPLKTHTVPKGDADDADATSLEDLERLLTSVAETAGRASGFSPLVDAASHALLQLASPYTLNPLELNPLRDVLEQSIDFARLAAASRHAAHRPRLTLGERLRRRFVGRQTHARPSPRVRVAATDLHTGAPHAFVGPHVTLEAVLASACLPTLHHAVIVDGQPYWDGGFSANPEIIPLLNEPRVRDTMVIVLNPLGPETPPRTAAGIAGETARLTFHRPLQRDLTEIARTRADGADRHRASQRAELWRAHRLHSISAARMTRALPASSKLQPTPELVETLFHAGRAAGRTWMDRHGAAVGQRETFDWRGIVGAQPEDLAG